MKKKIAQELSQELSQKLSQELSQLSPLELSKFEEEMSAQAEENLIEANNDKKLNKKMLEKNKNDLDVLKGLYSELYADYLKKENDNHKKKMVKITKETKIEKEVIVKKPNEKSSRSKASVSMKKNKVIGQKELSALQKAIKSADSEATMSCLLTGEGNFILTDTERDALHEMLSDEQIRLCSLYYLEQAVSAVGALEQHVGNVHVAVSGGIDKEYLDDKQASEAEEEKEIEIETKLEKVELCLKNLFGWWALDASSMMGSNESGSRAVLIEKMQWLKTANKEFWVQIVDSVNDVMKDELKDVYFEAQISQSVSGEEKEATVKLSNPIATSFYKGFDGKLWEVISPMEKVEQWRKFESLLLSEKASADQRDWMKKSWEAVWEVEEDGSSLKNLNSYWNINQLGSEYVCERLINLYGQIINDQTVRGNRGNNFVNEEGFISSSKKLAMVKEFSLLMSMGITDDVVSRDLMKLQSTASFERRQEFSILFNSIDARFDFFRKNNDILGFKSSQELLKEKGSVFVLKDVIWDDVLDSLKNSLGSFDEKSLRNKDFYENQAKWWGQTLVDMQIGLGASERALYEASSIIYSLKDFCNKALRLELFDVVMDALNTLSKTESEYKELVLNNKSVEYADGFKISNLNNLNIEGLKKEILNSLLETVMNKASIFVDEKSVQELFFVLLEMGGSLESLSVGIGDGKEKQAVLNEKLKKWLKDESFVQRFKEVGLQAKSEVRFYINYLPANSLSASAVFSLVENDNGPMLWSVFDKVNWQGNYEQVKELLRKKNAVGLISFVEWNEALFNDDIQKAKKLLTEDENFLYSIEKNYGTEYCIKDALKKGAIGLLDEMVLLNWPVKDVLMSSFDDYLGDFIKNPSSRVWKWFCNQMQSHQGWVNGNKAKVLEQEFLAQPNLTTISALFDLSGNLSWATNGIKKKSKLDNEEQKVVNTLVEYLVLKAEERGVPPTEQSIQSGRIDGKVPVGGNGVPTAAPVGGNRSHLNGTGIVTLFSEIFKFLNEEQKKICLKELIKAYSHELKAAFEENYDFFSGCVRFIDKKSSVEHIKSGTVLSNYMYSQVLFLAQCGDFSALKEVKNFSKALDPNGNGALICLKNTLGKSESIKEIKSLIETLIECTDISLTDSISMMSSCRFNINLEMINTVIKAFPSVKFKSVAQNLGAVSDSDIPLPALFDELFLTTSLIVNKFKEKNKKEELGYKDYKQELLSVASSVSLPNGVSIKGDAELQVCLDESVGNRNCRKVLASLFLNDSVRSSDYAKELICSFFLTFPESNSLGRGFSKKIINMKGCALVALSNDLSMFKELSPKLKADLDVCYEFAKKVQSSKSSLVKSDGIVFFKEFNPVMIKDLSLEVSNKDSTNTEELISKNFKALKSAYDDKYSTNPLTIFKRRGLKRKQEHWFEYAKEVSASLGLNNETGIVKDLGVALSGLVNKIDDADKALWIDSFNEFEKERETLLKAHTGNLLEQDVVLLKRLVDVNLPGLINKWSALPVDERHVKTIETGVSANEALKTSFEEAQKLLEQMRSRAINNAHLSFRAEVAVVNDKLAIKSFQNVVEQLQEDLIKDISAPVMNNGSLEPSAEGLSINSQIEYKDDLKSKESSASLAQTGVNFKL